MVLSAAHGALDLIAPCQAKLNVGDMSYIYFILGKEQLSTSKNTAVSLSQTETSFSWWCMVYKAVKVRFFNFLGGVIKGRS
jgi:formate/nitrite transporter FocA (FNT family)